MFKLQRKFPDFDFTFTTLGIPYNPSLRFVSHTNYRPTVV